MLGKYIRDIITQYQHGNTYGKSYEVHMEQGKVHVYTGDGKGKTMAAIGYGIRAAGHGKNVIIVQFLKEKSQCEIEFLKRLEPEIKWFRFEKSLDNFDKLSDEQKQQEIKNIKNGMNFAKKVLATGECDVLILDEILGLLDQDIITIDDIWSFINMKPNDVDIVLTGRNLDEGIFKLADEVSSITSLK